jgi:tetratricopeptide (TPR) repeat protein
LAGLAACTSGQTPASVPAGEAPIPAAATSPGLDYAEFAELQAVANRLTPDPIDNTPLELKLAKAMNDQDPDKPRALMLGADDLSYQRPQPCRATLEKTLENALAPGGSGVSAPLDTCWQTAFTDSLPIYSILTSQPAFRFYKDLDAALLSQAIQLWLTGHQGDARAPCERLLTDYPNSPHVPEVQALLGDLAFAAGNLDDARDAYQQAQTDPTAGVSVYVTYRLAWCALDAGDGKAALDGLTEALNQGKVGLSAAATSALEGVILRDLVAAWASAGSPDKASAYFSRYGGIEAPKMLASLAATYDARGDHKTAKKLHAQACQGGIQASCAALHE